MFARQLIAITLLCCSAGDGKAEPALAPTVPLGVYLKADLPLSSLPLDAAKTELEALLAPAGIELEWIEARNPVPIQSPQIVSVTLAGTCDPAKDAIGVFENHTALASTSVVDGKVLPFITVDCEALNRFLDQELVGAVDEAAFNERARNYGRAVARLLAHEFYHVLAKTKDHGRTGVAKTRFTVNDLLADRLVFEDSAVAKLRDETQPDPVVSAAVVPGSAESSGAEGGFLGKAFLGKAKSFLSVLPNLDSPVGMGYLP